MKIFKKFLFRASIACLLISLQSFSFASLSGEELGKILPLLFDTAMDVDQSVDYDGDGLSNGDEELLGTDIENSDTDGDGLPDGWEVTYLLDPLDPADAAVDSDGDGLSALQEYLAGTDLNNDDTDGDGLDDGWEVAFNVGPLDGDSSSYDHDGDGLANLDEYLAGLDPTNVGDDDHDGIVNSLDTLCPNDAENDKDGDSICYAADNCPLVANNDQADADGDGIGDVCDSLPNDSAVDSDGDGIADSADFCPLWPNATNNIDTNGDGIGDACQCGDLNGDGSVTLADHGVFDLYDEDIPGSMPLSLLELCDVSGDGLCTQTDYDLLATIDNPATVIRSRCPSLNQVTDRALGRVAFGADTWSRNRIALKQTQSGAPAATVTGYSGIDGYITEQLAPGDTDPLNHFIEDPVLNAARYAYAIDNGPESYPTLYKTHQWLRDHYCNTGSCDDRRTGHEMNSAGMVDLKFLRALYSRRQLEAVMADFWFNHFSVYSAGGNAIYTARDYEQVLLDNAFGQFHQLVQASSEQPAMLDYLDLQLSTQNNNNENYAREVMELHTIGTVDTYDEDTVSEATKILTGYRYIMGPDDNYEFAFNPSAHDTGNKQITLGSGANEITWLFPDANLSCGGDQATDYHNEGRVFLCLLAQHQKAGELVTTKLLKRFLGTTASENALLVDEVSQVWAGQHSIPGDLSSPIIEGTQADIASLLTAMLQTAQLPNQPSGFGVEFKRSLYYSDEKVKRPYVFAASLARAVASSIHGDTSNTEPVAGYSNLTTEGFSSSTKRAGFNSAIGAMIDAGESLLLSRPPTGFDEGNVAWLGSNGILIRAKHVDRLLNWLTGTVLPNNSLDLLNEWSIAPAASDTQIVAGVAEAVLPGGLLGLSEQAAIENYLSTHLSGSDAALKAQRSAELMLSTPQFMSH